MVRISDLFFAQTNISSIGDLKTAVGFGVGVLMVIVYIYAVILIVQGLLAERGDGQWKYTLAKGIGLFLATGIANILFLKFFGQTIPISFN